MRDERQAGNRVSEDASTSNIGPTNEEHEADVATTRSKAGIHLDVPTTIRIPASPACGGWPGFVALRIPSLLRLS